MEDIYVGIDWADDHHAVHVTDEGARPLDRFTIPHSYLGMQQLKMHLAKFSVIPEKTLI